MRADGVPPRKKCAVTGVIPPPVALLSTVVGVVIFLSGCSTGDPSLPGELGGSSVDRDLAECLQDKGWGSEVGADGGVSTEFDSDQIDQYEAASKECAETIPGIDDAGSVEVTNDLLADGYALQVDTLECLRAEGYAGLSDAPTLQSYLDSRGSWTPYSELPLDMSETEWIEVQRACPQPNISPSE